MAQSTLYPPIVEAYMPAFLLSEPAKIYFDVSKYNNPADINHIQLTLTHMNTGASALKKSTYPNGIKFYDFPNTNFVSINPLTDLEMGTSFAQGQYYKVQLRFGKEAPVGTVDAAWFTAQGLAGNFSEWSRVCLIKGIPAPNISMLGLREYDYMTVGAFDNYDLTIEMWDELTLKENALGANLDLTVNLFDNTDNLPTYTLVSPPSTAGMSLTLSDKLFKSDDDGFGVFTFVGQYSDADFSEPLKHYRMILWKQDKTSVLPFVNMVKFDLAQDITAAIPEDKNDNIDKYVIGDSGVQYPDFTIDNKEYYRLINGAELDYKDRYVYNGFYYSFNTILEELSASQSYVLSIIYNTKSGFVGTNTYEFIVDLSDTKLNQVSFTDSQMDNDNGRIAINTKSLAAPATNESGDHIVIKRAEHRSNFAIWTTVYDKEITNMNVLIDDTFYDYTAESGVIYKYWVSGNYVPIKFLPVYEDIFLLGQNNQQLKVQFNPQISSYRYLVGDNKTETLGGQFPFIRRNGNMRYREFSLNGLISHLSDENELFISNDILYGSFIDYAQDWNGLDTVHSYANDFNSFNQANKISPYDDIVREKLFRERVLEFLYDGQVKLYKSGPEGNILVRLTDISLTPVDSLGRRIYSFSATATEVDNFTIDNCKKYNLLVV